MVHAIGCFEALGLEVSWGKTKYMACDAGMARAISEELLQAALSCDASADLRPRREWRRAGEQD